MSHITFNPHEDEHALELEHQRRVKAAYSNMRDMEDYVYGEIYAEWESQQLRAERDALQAENQRLREALFRMTSLRDWLFVGYTIDQYNAFIHHGTAPDSLESEASHE